MKDGMTFGKRIENFWYHYKWHTVIALFFIITFIVCLTQCAMKEKPDESAILYVNENLLDNAANSLSEKLSDYIDDYNGNGEVLFRVNNVSYSTESTVNPSYAVTNSQKLFASVSAADYIIYIVDEHGYDYLMTDETRLFNTYDFLPDKDGTAWNWNGSKLQSEMKDSGLPENLYFCIRKVSGTTIEKNKNISKRLENAETLMKKLISEE